MSNFYAELEGIDKVLSKLAKLQNIDKNSPELIQSINREAMESMSRNTSSQGFPKSSQSCGFKMDGKFGEVGYFTKFDDWKELWFQNFGYMQYYYGKPLHYKTVVHVGVFDEIRHLTINDIKPVLERRVQQYLHNIIN